MLNKKNLFHIINYLPITVALQSPFLVSNPMKGIIVHEVVRTNLIVVNKMVRTNLIFTRDVYLVVVLLHIKELVESVLFPYLNIHSVRVVVVDLKNAQ